ncbi:MULTISPECIES: pyroglutamyl peptidase [Streptomyces]|uniref:Pyroglutamyl peptidase n=2 Tax=Streptomyces TaxID=1883 RepID=A0A514JVA4_9ACTN|nr:MULTISPECIES: pyroglutamyl peptidase [Streptomyces]MBA8978563.1 pyrrolidone-carboxylate peptidase [Streptomyces calvus]MYS31363.1 pyroglutamyl peptidase [Streptomyces sp. SID7804]QDI71273.1 pyroglutamyl peptidase [Streptomyces calvus]
MRSLSVRIGVLGLALLTALTAPTTATAAEPTAPTVEERRLDGAVPQEILRRSGFDSVAPDFARALDRARSYAEARRAVVRGGGEVWRRAVDRAQGRGPAGGDLSRDDDRPLYWARLGMTRELRAWQPEFALDEARRARLLEELERTSRGQDAIRYPQGGGVKRILVTGFDPFTLDRDIRISNPSGAVALALDGTVIETADGPARIETAVFPVRWRDFTDGAVERALRPHLPEVDLFTTVSQGRVGRFDIERTNGAWRGGFGDNENVGRTETVPVTDPATQPQWTSTTLPYAEIVAADSGRFPVYDNTSVTEIPAGGTEPVVRPEGPTPGSTARAGGGGDYLSNEIAYRATLLRDRLGLHDTLPGGHVHTPVLQFGAGNTTEVTDPEFVRNRLDIIGQVRSIVTVAVSATERTRG